jgi:hypothetical protein
VYQGTLVQYQERNNCSLSESTFGMNVHVPMYAYMCLSEKERTVLGLKMLLACEFQSMCACVMSRKQEQSKNILGMIVHVLIHVCLQHVKKEMTVLSLKTFLV